MTSGHETSFSTPRFYSRRPCFSNFSFVLDYFSFQVSTKHIVFGINFLISYGRPTCSRNLHFHYNICAMMPRNARLCSRTSMQRRAKALATYLRYNEVSLYRRSFPYISLLLGKRLSFAIPKNSLNRGSLIKSSTQYKIKDYDEDRFWLWYGNSTGLLSYKLFTLLFFE